MSCGCDGYNGFSGGGGGAVSSVTGAGGISCVPTVGAVVVDGSALYARDGTNGAMLANINCGAFDLVNCTNGTFLGSVHIFGKLTVDGLIDPTGLVLTPQFAAPFTGTPTAAGVWVRSADGKLIYTDTVNVPHVLESSAPAGPLNAIQFQAPLGTFAGSVGATYSEPAPGSSAFASQITGSYAQSVTHTPSATEVLRLDAGSAPQITMRQPGQLGISTSLSHNTTQSVLQRVGGPGTQKLRIFGQDELLLDAGLNPLLLTSAAGTLAMPTTPPFVGGLLQIVSIGAINQIEFASLPVAASLQSAYQVGNLINVSNSFGAVRITQGGAGTGAQSSLDVQSSSATEAATKSTAIGAGFAGMYGISQGTTGQPGILGEAQGSGGVGIIARHSVLNGGDALRAESNGATVFRCRNGIVELGAALLDFPSADGTAGQMLGTLGAGQLAFASIFNQRVQDEAANLAQRPTINFIGAGVTATDDAGNNRTNVTIPGGGASNYQTIQDEGAALTQRPTFNFIGANVSAVDDALNLRTNITITGISSPGVVTVTDKASLVAAAASTAAGTITLVANTSYLVAGNIDLTQLVGGGSTFNDRILLGVGTSLTGAGARQYTISANNATSCVTFDAAANIVENLQFSQAGAGVLLDVPNTSGTAFVSSCRMLGVPSINIRVSNAGNKLIRLCTFQAGTNFIETFGGVAIGSISVQNCQFSAGQNWLLVALTTSVIRVRIESCLSLTSQGTSTVTIAGTALVFELMDCNSITAGTSLVRTGTLTASKILNNVFEAANQNSVFTGFSPTVGGAAPVGAFTLLRGNLWRNAAATSFFLLRESAMQTANNPPA